MFEYTYSMIQFPGTENKIDGYLVLPKTTDKRPAIIVIHEIFGLNDQIKGVANKLASEGYVVIAPHIYSAIPLLNDLFSQTNIGLTMQFMSSLPAEKRVDMNAVQMELTKQPEDKRPIIQKVMATMFAGQMPRDQLTKELTKTVDFLNSQDFVIPNKVASVGFCFGGGMSINLACHSKLAGSIVFYGQNPEPIDLVNKIECPVLGIYGGEDTRINSKLNELVTVMVAGKKDFEMKIYPGAPHAFFNETNKSGYREEAAKDAWDRCGMSLKSKTTSNFWNLSNPSFVAFAYENGEIIGAVVYTTQGHSKSMDISFFLYENSNAKYLLLEYLARHIDHFSDINFPVFPFEQPEFWIENSRITISSRNWSNTSMGRVINIEDLEGIAIGVGSIKVKIIDNQILNNNGIFYLHSENGYLEVKKVDANQGKADCILTISGLSALVYGGYNIHDFPFKEWIFDYQENTLKTLNTLFPPVLAYMHEEF